MLHVLAIPICGFLKSSSSNPTARNMAREGVCVSPSTMTDEYGRRLSVIVGPIVLFSGSVNFAGNYIKPVDFRVRLQQPTLQSRAL